MKLDEVLTATEEEHDIRRDGECDVGEEVRHDGMKSPPHEVQLELYIDEPHMLSNMEGVKRDREVGSHIASPSP